MFWNVTFLANLLLNVNILLTLDENLLEKSPRDRKFRWYKYYQEGLKRENWFLWSGLWGKSNFFGGVFGLYLFLANLPLNMLVTLDSNLFHENLLEKTKSKGSKI